MESRRRVLGSIVLLLALMVSGSGSCLGAQFSYLPPGDLIPGSGTGRVDCSNYAPGIRFPLEAAPGFPNSQVYNPGGSQSSGSQCSSSNYDYPWRDNFCETRSRPPSDTPMCPNQTQGHHQGQDIRPSTCADNTHWVVSATSGTVTWIPTSSTWWVSVTASDGTVYSYLHMTSIQVSVGQQVSRGQRLGRVSNKMGTTPTTIHLHFEYSKTISGLGFTPVPPYMSLLQGYRELIGSLGSGVRAQATANLNVRSAPGGTFIAEAPAGSLGTITGSSQVASYGGYCWIWWPVQWDSGLVGWSVDNYMLRSSSCSYTLSPTSQQFGASSGSGSFSVQTQSGCPWSASTSASWISITSGSGSGNGTVSFNVSANSSTSSRSGTITAGGRTFTVSQSGVSCSYSLSPTSQSFGSSGGPGSFSVQTQSGCSWSPSTSSSWISIDESPRSGNGTVSFNVSSNSGTGSRSGTITVAGQTFTVSQSGISCSYSLSPSSQSFGSGGGSSSFSVSTQSGCSWSASTSASWISIISGSGSGNGAVSFNVDANSSTSSRSGTVNVAGQTFTVNQSGTAAAGPRAPVADFDGDETSDWVIYRNGAWLYFGPCGHPLTQPGPALDESCSACVSTVCDQDSFCCNFEWDEFCVDEAASWCQ